MSKKKKQQNEEKRNNKKKQQTKTNERNDKFEFIPDTVGSWLATDQQFGR